MKQRATNFIVIDGVTYCKCYAPDYYRNQFNTPCALCHPKVQEVCPIHSNELDGFCHDEHVCYINFTKYFYNL